MAVETTPLGFQKPDGNERVRDGDNVISTNAQKAEDLLTAVRARLAMLEGAAGFAGSGLDLADSVVSALLDTATLSRNKLDSRYLNMVNVKHYGALGNNSADDYAAIQAAGNAVPDGGTLYFPPGDYRCLTRPNITGKSITIEATGATIINATDADAAFDIRGGMDATYPVTAITASTVTIDGNVIPTLELTTTGVTGYATGDLIKLVADDAIPGGRPEVDGKVARVGEFFPVHTSAGTTVTVLSAGTMDPMTTNIRVARMKPKTCTINGLTVDVDTSVSTSGFGLRIFEMMNPVLNNVSSRRSMGSGITMIGCYSYTANTPDIGFAANTGQFGYGFNDTSCAFGVVVGLSARHVRHAFTDGTNQILAGSTSLHQYGRTYGYYVSDAVGQSTSGSGFDSHQYSRGGHFDNCKSYDAGSAGFTLRGQGHTITNSKAIRPLTGLLIFSENPTDGDSHSHTIDGLTIDSPRSMAIDWYVNKASNALDPRISRFGRITLINAPANSISFRNATGRFNFLEVSASNFTTNSAKLGTLTNANISIETLRTDFTAQTTAVSTCQPFSMSGGSVLRINDWRNTFGGATNANRFNYFVDTSGGVPGTVTNRLQVERLVSDFMSATSAIPWADSEGDTYVNFKALKSSGGNACSLFIPFSTADLTTARWQLNKTTDTGLTLLGTITAATNMFILRNGRSVGQSARIFNSTGGAALTVRNGSTYNVQTLTGADVVLNTGQSMVITWDGAIWRQVA